MAPASVGIRELRQNLSKHLERVKRGETLSVTERGREVAKLVPSIPVEPRPPGRVDELLEEMRRDKF